MDKIVNKIFNGSSKYFTDAINDANFIDRYISFISQTIINDRTGEWYNLNDPSSLNIDDIDVIISKGIAKIITSGSSSYHDIIKMQIQIHDEIIQNNKDVDDNISSKYRIITSDALSIAKYNSSSKTPAIEDDKDAQNQLYHKMLNFVSSYNISGKIDDDKTDKEIKAAFESVYPRSGVSAFLTITTIKGKTDQLMELAKIVLGIRLFNKSIGKGGYGIPNTDADIKENLKQILHNMNDQIKYIKQSNKRREKLIVKSILLKRKSDLMQELENRKSNPIMDDDILDIHDEYDELLAMMSTEEKNTQSLGIYKDEQVAKWINELAFHNQYLNYLTQLHYTFHTIFDRINFISQALLQSYEELGTLVGSKTVISKKLVYPKFLILGNLWYECGEEALRYKNAKKSFDLLINRYEQELMNSLDITDDNYHYLQLLDSYENTGQKIQSARNNMNINSSNSQIINSSSINVDAAADAKTVSNSTSQNGLKDNGKDDFSNNVKADYQPIAVTADAKDYKFDTSAPAPLSDNKTVNNDDELVILSADSKALEYSVAAAEVAMSKQLSGSTSSRKGLLSIESSDITYNNQCVLLNPSNHLEFKHMLTQNDFISIAPSTVTNESSSSRKNSSNNNNITQIELNGFCPFNLIDKQGSLIQGNIHLGIIQYQQKHYLCESSAAIKAFVKNPSYYLEKIQNLIIFQPEYLLLLNQIDSEKFENISGYLFPSPYADNKVYEDYLNKVSSGVNKLHKVKCDASTETPTHFIESNRDPNYHWNELDIKREVLKIVKLTNCKTTSSQTVNTHFRRDNQTQVYLPKNNSSQTKRDMGTNPKLVTTYISGLSGDMNKNEPRSTYVSKYIKNDSKEEGNDSEGKESDNSKRIGARVVTLTLDL